MSSIFKRNLNNNLGNESKTFFEEYRKETNFGQSFNYIDKEKKYKFSDGAVANENTELLIVGTYTPFSGRQNGYYYTSEDNIMYGILDECLDLDYLGYESLSDIKNSLNNDPSKREEKINNIKEILRKNHIAFMDVIEYAIADNNCAADDAIEKFCLDREAFKEFFKINTEAIVVFNNRNAEEAFKRMKFEYGQIFRTSLDKAVPIWKNILEPRIRRSTTLRIKN